MRLLPQHKLGTVLGLFSLTLACYGGLRYLGHDTNDRILAY